MRSVRKVLIIKQVTAHQKNDIKCRNLVQRKVVDSVMRCSAIVIIWILFLTAVQADGAESALSFPLNLQAGEVQYNGNLRELLASDGISTTYRGYDITADELLWSEAEKDLEIFGAVQLKEIATGNQYEADEVRLHDDIITIDNLRGELLEGQIMVKAEKVVKIGEKYEADDFVFSPCRICPGNTQEKPLWKLRSKKVTVDNVKQDTHYRGLALEIWNRPVLYLPYFSSPSLGAKRRSGFLIPSFYFNRQLGMAVRVPYYLDISPNFDITVIPNFISRQSLLYELEVRHLLSSGAYKIYSNFTYDRAPTPGDRSELRGYLALKGNVIPKENQEVGVDIRHLFDNTKTYLKKYEISNDDILISKAYWRYQYRDNYLTVNTLALQDLRPKDTVNGLMKLNNIISVPELKWHWEKKLSGESATILMNGRAAKFLSAEWQNLGGYASSDIILQVQNDMPDGSIIRYSPILRLSAQSNGALNVEDAGVKPVSAVLKANWEKPYTWASWLVTPTVGVTLAGYDRVQFLTEECLDINTRFGTGLQSSMQEKGEYVDYGVKGVSPDDYTIFLGGRIRFDDLPIPVDNSWYCQGCYPYQKARHSYVAKLDVDRERWSLVNALWAARGNDGLTITNNQLDLIFSQNNFSLGVDYSYINNQYYYGSEEQSNFDHEIGSDMWYNVKGNWWVNFGIRTKLGKKPPGWHADDQVISNNATIRYKVDCLQVDLGVSKNYLKFRSLEPYATYFLNLSVPILREIL